jgi:small-conductance mechanosensitive channel
MQLNAKLDALLVKAHKLVGDNKQLAARNVELTAEIEDLKHVLQQELKKNEELNNKIKIIKLAQNLGTETSENIEITELKRKLNEYIKEIDSCMAMLNE